VIFKKYFKNSGFIAATLYFGDLTPYLTYDHPLPAAGSYYNMNQLIGILQKGTSYLILLQKGIGCWVILQPIPVVGSSIRRIPTVYF
jgi:hypothetical protein